MNISQFLKSLGLEHLRDIFETEQVNSCVLFQLFSFELAAICFLYYISSLFCDLKCSTICLMRDLFVFTLFVSCLWQFLEKPGSLPPSIWQLGDLSFLFMSSLSQWLSRQVRPWEVRVQDIGRTLGELRSRNCLNNTVLFCLEVFVSRRHWHLYPHLMCLLVRALLLAGLCCRG